MEIPSLNLSRALQGHDVEGKGSCNELHLLRDGKDLENIPLVGQAEWRASVNPVSNNEFWLTGWVQTILATECARCLEPVQLPIETRFEWLLRYNPNTKIAVLDYGTAKEEEIVFGDPNFDLSPWLAEAVAEATPLIVLHNENCKGLCIACGTNLNNVKNKTCPEARGDCPQFGANKTNTPLANLKDLLKE